MSAGKNNRAIGIQRNKLLRYKKIKELYQESIKAHPHTPLTKILSEYIYPVYPISRTTLYEVLFTPITQQLKELEEMEKKQIDIQKAQVRLFPD